MSVTAVLQPEITRFIGINQKAKDWENEGFKVKANIGGWDRPSTVEGLMPDLRGDMGSNIRIGLVSLEEELEENMAKWGKVVEYAKNNKNVSLRVYTLGKNGECYLNKIIT